MKRKPKPVQLKQRRSVAVISMLQAQVVSASATASALSAHNFDHDRATTQPSKTLMLQSSQPIRYPCSVYVSSAALTQQTACIAVGEQKVEPELVKENML